MRQIVMVALGHLLILSLAIFGFWLSHRYISRRFIRSSIHCPTQLALKGQYEERAQLGMEIACCPGNRHFN